MFERALVSTDFSDGLYRLACVVPSLVEGGLKKITFFHDVPVKSDRSIPKVDEAGMEAAKKRLEGLIQTVPEAEVNISVACGRPSDNILKQVQSSSAEVLFLGTRTRNLLSEKLFGSTTMGLVERIPIPIMIMRPQLVSTYTTEELSLRCRKLFHYLLIPYDGSKGAHEFLDNLKARIRENSNPSEYKYLLVWVVDENIRRELRGENPLKDAEERLHKAADTLRELGVVVDAVVTEGDPLEEILRTAEKYDISAIATRSRGIGGVLRWSIPSLTREILRQSWHPVLYFPNQS